jgi:hypothetical protein
MNALHGRVFGAAKTQHLTFATWQLRQWGWGRGEIDAAVRGRRRLYQGVYSWDGDVSEFGWLMATALAYGPDAALSHVTSLQVRGLHPWEDGDIHVSVPRGGGRTTRDGIVVHRRSHPFEVELVANLPLTSPTRALIDAKLPRHELYCALEEASRRGLPVAVPGRVAELQRRVKGYTRSPAEAEALLVFQDHGIALPLVNHQLNGVEADFHWPQTRTVLEVDGWEWHKERPQFEEDRRRELIHAAAGWQVIRASARQIFETPEAVVRAVSPPVL